MKQYLDLLQKILNEGVNKGDRTGTGMRELFGAQLRFNLQDGFPLLTTKKMFLKGITHELLWFLRGDTNIKYLTDNDVHIWDAWSKKDWQVGAPSDHRPLVWIRSKSSTGETTYSGDYATSGLEAARGSVDDKLRNTWVRMMRRCYDSSNHNYETYGGSGVTVHKLWHNIRNFVWDVKRMPNWEWKLKAWNEYELDKDYYGSLVYGPTTCVWLHTSENNYYGKSSYPLEAIEPDGHKRKFLTQAHAARELDMSTSSLSRFVEAGVVDGILKGNNKRFKGWKFKRLEKKEELLRFDFSNGDLGPVYGSQWRNFNGVDQIANLIEEIKTKPNSRRMIVTAWNPAEVDNMALPPCHLLMQFSVEPYAPKSMDQEVIDDLLETAGADPLAKAGKLHCQMYQRSADMFLGVPFNIASYSMLTMMIAQVCGLKPGNFIHTFGSAHIYFNHFDQVMKQLDREPFALPTMEINPKVKDIDGFKYKDFNLVGYEHHPGIKAPIAV